MDEEGEMSIGTQAPIGHEHVTWWSARMDRLHLGEAWVRRGATTSWRTTTGRAGWWGQA